MLLQKTDAAAVVIFRGPPLADGLTTVLTSHVPCYRCVGVKNVQLPIEANSICNQILFPLLFFVNDELQPQYQRPQKIWPTLGVNKSQQTSSKARCVQREKI